ncbi:MAG: hypothetical protein HYR74_05400 [Candidatus Eisenbacteria bacterium]|nr:hypothetical protein [Candidatus Eisenbacteria bacterium]
MILDLESTLRTVFSIYAVVWVGVVLVLFVVTGLLTRKAERIRQKSHH